MRNLYFTGSSALNEFEKKVNCEVKDYEEINLIKL